MGLQQDLVNAAAEAAKTAQADVALGVRQAYARRSEARRAIANAFIEAVGSAFGGRAAETARALLGGEA